MIKVAIGVDCDPDRDSRKLKWKGIEAIPKLFDIPGVKFTLNVRADSQIKEECGDYNYCHKAYKGIWEEAKRRGYEIAWHLHFYERSSVVTGDWIQSFNAGIIRDSIKNAYPLQTIHMGWCWQNPRTIRLLADVGVRVDYSPLPGMRFADKIAWYNWTHFPYHPVYLKDCDVLMLPAFTYKDKLLARKSETDYIMLHPTITPIFYSRLLRVFKRRDMDHLVMYFHADEIAGAVGGWRNRLYTFDNLRRNIDKIRKLGVEFVTISELRGSYENYFRSQSWSKDSVKTESQ